jgi:hypothetical protein
MPIAPRGNQGGRRMWPSLETASRVSDISNFFFIGSLAVGVISTILIVWMANVKEGYWEKDRRESTERIAQLNNETARLRADSTANAEATLATAQAGQANAIAAQSLLATAEVLAVAQGWVSRQNATEATRVLFIISKVQPFAGKQFTATSSDIVFEAFRGSLRQALKAAGWIEVNGGDAGDHKRQTTTIGAVPLVKIRVDTTKISELWGAAEALVSALKDERIEALAERISTPVDPSNNPNIIHILIDPKTSVMDPKP